MGLALYTCVLAGCGAKDDLKQPEAEVDLFHKRWNNAYFTGVYNDAHVNFRTAQSSQLTIGQLQHNRKFYGTFKSATRRRVNINSADSEKDITLDYESIYEHGTASEEFKFRMTNGKPLLMNYKMLPGSRDKTK